MAETPIPFGPWEPDRAPFMSSALTEAVNVLPIDGAYAPVSGPMPTSLAVLPGASYGLFAIPQPDGTPLVYAATYNNLYRISTGAPTQVYSGGAISAAYWRFAQYQQRTIAINPYVNPLGATAAGSFTALGGTPPKAKAVGVVGDFLVLGNLQNDGVDGFQPNRIRWCGFDNPDTWGTNVGTQADYQPMPDQGGPVIAITGREYGTVYQRKIISRMTNVGPPNVFTFEVVEQQRGAISAGAVCNAGDADYFIADDGVFMWNGVGSVPIGEGRCNRWLRQRLDYSRADGIVSGYDPQANCVWWGIPEIARPNIVTILVYSIGQNQFVTVSTPVEALATSLSLPTPLESMPTPDTFGGSFDDPAYAGGAPILALIDTAHTYGTFSGQILEATLTTGDYQSQSGSRTLVTGVRPLVDSDNTTVAVGERNSAPGEPVVWYDAVPVNAIGVAPQRVDGRYIRYRVAMPVGDGWSRAVGIEPAMKTSGRR
jgi:hypothetical protein